MLKDPQNTPRKKEIKKERPTRDIGLNLKDLLRPCGEPAVGLDHVTEYWNPCDWRDHPMYTCSLRGCKSAWGTSDDMFNHVKNSKHQQNFFGMKYMTKNQLLNHS